jgi:predicted nucleic acid-binding protein
LGLLEDWGQPLRQADGERRRVGEPLRPGLQGLLLSVPLMLEYEEVLKQDDMRAKSHLTLEEIDVLLDMLAAVGTPQTSFFQWRPQLPDPDGEMVLELAVNGHADAIVTVNVRHFLPAARTFGVEVLRPGAFLRRLHA